MLDGNSTIWRHPTVGYPLLQSDNIKKRFAMVSRRCLSISAVFCTFFFGNTLKIRVSQFVGLLFLWTPTRSSSPISKANFLNGPIGCVLRKKPPTVRFFSSRLGSLLRKLLIASFGFDFFQIGKCTWKIDELFISKQIIRGQFLLVF